MVAQTFFHQERRSQAPRESEARCQDEMASFRSSIMSLLEGSISRRYPSQVFNDHLLLVRSSRKVGQLWISRIAAEHHSSRSIKRAAADAALSRLPSKVSPVRFRGLKP